MEGESTYDVRPLPKPREGQAIQPGDEPVYERTVVEIEEGVIKFTCSVWKVSTLADGGIRLVLDLEEKAREHMPELARCQQNGIALEIEASKS